MIYKLCEALIMVAIAMTSLWWFIKPHIKSKAQPKPSQGSCATPCATCRMCDKANSP